MKHSIRRNFGFAVLGLALVWNAPAAAQDDVERKKATVTAIAAAYRPALMQDGNELTEVRGTQKISGTGCATYLKTEYPYYAFDGQLHYASENIARVEWDKVSEIRLGTEGVTILAPRAEYPKDREIRIGGGARTGELIAALYSLREQCRAYRYPNVDIGDIELPVMDSPALPVGETRREHDWTVWRINGETCIARRNDREGNVIGFLKRRGRNLALVFTDPTMVTEKIVSGSGTVTLIQGSAAVEKTAQFGLLAVDDFAMLAIPVDPAWERSLGIASSVRIRPEGSPSKTYELGYTALSDLIEYDCSIDFSRRSGDG